MIPIVVGLGVTVVALTGRAIAHTFTRYRRLSPQMIATLNKIRLETHLDTELSTGPGEASHIKYLKSRFENRGFEHTMTEREALQVLGIEASEIAGLTKDLLRQRYRKLMVLNHPDRKGSVYLSQKINQAKDVLEKSYLVKDR